MATATAHPISPNSLSPTLSISGCTEPPRKRKRHTRTTTGCKQCRVQRVKCPEGPVSPTTGRKIICRRCWETDQPCFYPIKGMIKRGKSKDRDDAWERAEDVEEWCPMSGGSDSAHDSQDYQHQYDDRDEMTIIDWSTLPTAHVNGTHSTAFITSVDTKPMLSSQHPNIGPIGAASIPADAPAMQPLSMDPTNANGVSVHPYPPAYGYTNVDKTLTVDMINYLLNPNPMSNIGSFSLAAMSQSTGDRAVVSYLESRGCNEIQSATQVKHNWIFSQLFPRLLTVLSAPVNADEAGASVRDWLHHSLIQLAYVHRGNIDADTTKAWHWRAAAARHRQKAGCAILRAKVRYPERQWQTEEYLMGFFVRCMADMLDAGLLQIDRSTAFELPLDRSSSFYPSLRDMIALYATIQFSCTPLDVCSNMQPIFEMSPVGPEWVERFVGFSRRIVILLGRVHSLVVQRSNLLRLGGKDGSRASQIEAQAQELLVSLNEGWDWEEGNLDVGRSDRIQRGNEVMRSALRVMLLCEVLNVDLNDPRLERERLRAAELVADAEPVGMGGFQWALTIIGMYTRDPDTRSRIQHLLKLVLSLSFGSNYRGTDEILDLCWDALDRNGQYENGIAPWRDAMGALGRNLFV